MTTKQDFNIRADNLCLKQWTFFAHNRCKRSRERITSGIDACGSSISALLCSSECLLSSDWSLFSDASNGEMILTINSRALAEIGHQMGAQESFFKNQAALDLKIS